MIDCAVEPTPNGHWSARIGSMEREFVSERDGLCWIIDCQAKLYEHQVFSARKARQEKEDLEDELAALKGEYFFNATN